MDFNLDTVYNGKKFSKFMKQFAKENMDLHIGFYKDKSFILSYCSVWSGTTGCTARELVRNKVNSIEKAIYYCSLKDTGKYKLLEVKFPRQIRLNHSL